VKGNGEERKRRLRMIQIDLTPEEQSELRTALESYLSDLRMEIAGTDSYDFRKELKERKAALEKVLGALEG
jgi:hypothetical protein